MTAELPPYAYPTEALKTVHLKKTLEAQDFVIPVPDDAVQDGTVHVRAIQVIENHAETQEKIITLPVTNGTLDLAASSVDACKIAVIERHGHSGALGVGVVTGLGFNKPVALASTVAHDSHNVMILGTSDALMAQAGNELAEAGGGVLILIGDPDAPGDVRRVLLSLPIAGLMSPEPFEEVAQASKAVSDALVEAGCTLNYAFMTISLLALAVIPELRLTDKGLVKIGTDGFSLVDLIVRD